MGVEPHYFDAWEPTHQGNADVVERLVTISSYSYASSYLTQYFVGPIYIGVEEDPRVKGTTPEVGPLRPCYSV
jgi:hypothetical protein